MKGHQIEKTAKEGIKRASKGHLFLIHALSTDREFKGLKPFKGVKGIKKMKRLKKKRGRG